MDTRVKLPLRSFLFVYAALCIQLSDVINELARQRGLGCTRERARAAIVQQRDLGVVGSDGALGKIRDHKRHLLLAALHVRELLQILAFSGKSDAKRGV